MKCLITGEVGIGKTTVCKEVIEKAKKNNVNCVGILTEKVEQEDDNSILVVEDLSTGERRTLAYRKPITHHEVPHGIHFCSFIFDRNAIEFAKKALMKNGDLLIIDEIGYLELEGKGIDNAISTFESSANRNAILVVRKELRDRMSNHINCIFKTFEVNRENRAKLPAIIFDNTCCA